MLCFLFCFWNGFLRFTSKRTEIAQKSMKFNQRKHDKSLLFGSKILSGIVLAMDISWLNSTFLFLGVIFISWCPLVMSHAAKSALLLPGAWKKVDSDLVLSLTFPLVHHNVTGYLSFSVSFRKSESCKNCHQHRAKCVKSCVLGILFVNLITMKYVMHIGG